MNIVEMNQGKKIAYELDEEAKAIIFTHGEDELIVGLAKRQTDVEVVVDISFDRTGGLTTGVQDWYVANISIPPVQRTMQATGQVDDSGNPVLEEVISPLELTDIKLTLWELPQLNQDENGGE